MRAHYRAPVQDGQGNLLPSTVVTVFVSGTSTLFAGPIYADDISGALLGNPFTTQDGNISFYMDTSQRVDLGISPPGLPQSVIPDIDVEVPGGGAVDVSHITGSTITNSVVQGLGYQLTPTGFFFYQEGP